MQVIWHHHEIAQFDMRKPLGDPLPLFLGNLPCFTQIHLSIHNLTEHFLPVPGIDRDEICPGLGVIVTRNSDGMVMMDLGIKIHALCSFTGSERG